MGAAVPAIMVITAIAEAGMQQAQAQAEGDVARQRAQSETEAASDAKMRGSHEAALAAEKGGRIAARQRAIVGATGFASDGSYAGVEGGTQAAIWDDVLSIRANAARDAWGHTAAAGYELGQGAARESAGTGRAFSTLLGGLSQAGGSWYSDYKFSQTNGSGVR